MASKHTSSRSTAPTPNRGGFTRTQVIVNAAVAVLAASTMIWAGIVTTSSTTIPKTSRRPILLDQTEMETLLARAGLNPRSLAAAGVTTEQALAVATAARSYINSNVELIRSALDTNDRDRQNVERLQRLVQSGQALPEQITEYEAGLTRVLASSTLRQNALSGLREAATVGLNEQQKSRLGTIAANRGRDVPSQFLTVSKSEPEWVALQGALANQRANSGLGIETSPGAQRVLHSWQGLPEVSAAAGYLDANLPGISTAWNQGLTP